MKRIRKSTGVKLLTGVLLFALTCTTVRAQSTAQIKGTVKDQTGAVLPGADIKATQTATGAVRTAVSDENGGYVLASLPIGPYAVEVGLPGFRTYVQTGIVLQVDSNPTINAVLAVGQVSEQVEVQADAAMVETHSTGIGTVVDNQRVVEMPLNGRNLTELVFLAGLANVGTGSDGGSRLNSVRNYPTVVVSVAGGIGNGITFSLDGSNHNDANNGLNLPLPFPDALQEFKVETSALPAQYGLHSSAAVNAVTKSGTNEFHGDLFEFVRNGVFNARDFFASSRDTLKRNQFGGVVGGPVMKSRLFFFGGYQGTIQKSSPPGSVAYVPTAAMLAGDFTAIASPACQGGKQVTLPASLGFVNNQIATSRLSPVSLTLQKVMPLSTDSCGKITYGLVSNQTENVGVARLDYQRSDKHSLYGRFLITNLEVPSSYDGTNPITHVTAAAHYRTYALALGDTYLIGSGIVNSFRAGANRTAVTKAPDKFQSWSDLGVQDFTVLTPNTIRLSVSGSGFAIGGASQTPNRAFTGPNPNLAEDISVVKGAHQVGFGASYMYQLMNYNSGVSTPGAFTFNGTVSGIPLVDYMLGSASAWNQGDFSLFYDRQHYFALYGQDSWKISPRLTVNYGLRWEPYTAPSNKFRQWTHFDPALFDQNVHSTTYVNAPAGLIYPGDAQYTIGNAPQGSKHDNFMPRVGLVWDPKGDGRMTVRAAYGMFSQRESIFTYVGFDAESPWSSNVSLSNVNFSNPWANYAGGNPYPRTLSKNSSFPTFANYATFPFDYKPTYVNQWNLSLQRQIGTDWLLTANYIGNNTIHLITSDNLNYAVFLGLGACTLNGVNYPVCSTTANTNQRRVYYLKNPAQGQYYSFIGSLNDGGTATYNGLLLSVQKRLSHGLSVLANHTWSHCIGDYYDNEVGNSAPYNVPGDRRALRGNCAASTDQRHVFNLSLVAQTPKFSNRALQLLAGDWQISPIIKIKSAQFFTVTTGVDNALSGGGVQVPNLMGNPYPENQTINHWIDAAAFASPAPGTYGNAGINNMKGPGTFQLDMGLTRTFKIREMQTLQVRAEAFNLPNHLNPSTPVSTLNSGSAFGQIQSDISGTSGLTAGDPRIIQFALKYVF